jgi:hypothetical protein
MRRTIGVWTCPSTGCSPIKESFALKVDVEAFNVLNHPVLGSPASTVTTQASFGQISTLAFGNAQRILQFAVKLQF